MNLYLLIEFISTLCFKMIRGLILDAFSDSLNRISPFNFIIHLHNNLAAIAVYFPDKLIIKKYLGTKEKGIYAMFIPSTFIIVFVSFFLLFVSNLKTS